MIDMEKMKKKYTAEEMANLMADLCDFFKSKAVPVEKGEFAMALLLQMNHGEEVHISKKERADSDVRH
jgi:hypothetical protein